jgi:hypothetical protein
MLARWCLELSGTFIYFCLICGAGMPVVTRLGLRSEHVFVGSLIIGSALLGGVLYVLAQTHHINYVFLLSLLLIAGAITSFQIKQIIYFSKSFFSLIGRYIFNDGKSAILFSALMIAIFVWYLLLAGTPPRSGDAMRYHLAQLNDMVSHEGLEFRPYFHYNFPMYFSTLFLPVYYFLGGIGMKFAHCIYFFLSVVMTISLCSKWRIKHPRILVVLFLLIPISYHEAHIVTNDWVLVFYILAGMFFLTSDKEAKRPFPIMVYCAFGSLGFALGVKYHAVLFIPWFFLLAWKELSGIGIGRRVYYLLGALLVMSIVASPWYIRNAVNVGNPVWPLLLDLFPGTNTYLYLVAKNYVESLAGSHSIAGTLSALKDLVLFPMIPFTIWLLMIAGLFLGRKNDFFFKTGIISFFSIWWIFQPRLYPRFAVYILPFALIVATSLAGQFDSFKNKVPKYVYLGVIGITLLYGVALGAFYSGDYIGYYLDRDLEKYHRATWFHNEYEWINRSLPKDAKLLVSVTSGHTYYLDREYLRADPWLSGLIDWNKIKSIDELDKELAKLDATYVLYEDRDWSYLPGGKNMMRLMWELRENTNSHVLWEREVSLCWSRIRNLYRKTKVVLIKIG